MSDNANASVDWRDKKYQDTLETELRGLERRCLADPSCTVEDLERVLRHLYNNDGADWYGRGEVQDIVLGATIAAYEIFVARLKSNPR